MPDYTEYEEKLHKEIAELKAANKYWQDKNTKSLVQFFKTDNKHKADTIDTMLTHLKEKYHDYVFHDGQIKEYADNLRAGR